MPAANERKYTFVTVFYEDEYELLRLQARSIDLYCADDIVEKIIVIDNSERPLPKNWKTELLGDYGRYSGLVEIVAASDIASLPWGTGWRTQQILKLTVAQIVSTERYLLLDAKNHLLFTLRRDALEASDGRPLTHLHGYVNHPLRGHLERVLAYYDIEPAQHVTRFTATVTPFVMDTAIVREMTADLAAREGKSFEKAFTERALTEFFSYAAFIIKSGRNLADVYDFRQTSAPCIWEYMATGDQIENTIAKVAAQQTPFFSVHRAAIAKLDDSARNVVARLWHDRSLFATFEEAEGFLSHLQRKYQKTVWSRPFWRALKKATRIKRTNSIRSPRITNTNAE